MARQLMAAALEEQKKIGGDDPAGASKASARSRRSRRWPRASRRKRRRCIEPVSFDAVAHRCRQHLDHRESAGRRLAGGGEGPDVHEFARARGGLSATTAYVHATLARVQVKMGQTDEARKNYQKFLELFKDADPDLPLLVASQGRDSPSSAPSESSQTARRQTSLSMAQARFSSFDRFHLRQRIGVGAAGADRIQAVVPGARASLDAGRGAVSERAERHAAAAHGAHVARPLRAPRVCEERVRRVDRERQGPAAHRDASRSAPMGRRQSRRHGRRHLQDLRRSHRRHLSRHRRHPRAHQHSGGVDVRARLVRAAGARDVRAAARQDVEGGDAVVPDERSARLHRAEHPLPDGQPHRLQQLHAADVHGGRWAEAEWAAADVPHRADARRHRGGSRCLREGRRAHRPRGHSDLRRAAELRDQHLYVPERLPAMGQRRRHGASQQHVAHELGRVAQSAAALGHSRHGGARVLPRLEHGAPALGRASSRSTSKKPT